MFIVYDLYAGVKKLGEFTSKKDAYIFKRKYEKESHGLCRLIVTEYITE